MTREEYCRLIRSGLINTRSAVRGFRALARLAPNHDVRDMMLLLAHNSHHSHRALRRQLARYCTLLNNVNGNGITIL